MKRKLDLKPGVKYRGYGLLNDFGEFEFVPEQTGSRQGKRRVLKVGSNFSVAETVNSIVVYCNLDKQHEKIKLMREYLNVSNQVLEVLRDYEI